MKQVIIDDVGDEARLQAQRDFMAPWNDFFDNVRQTMAAYEQLKEDNRTKDAKIEELGETIDKLTDAIGYKNIMYTLHFYANTHGQWLRDRADYAMSKGLPVFVSECAGMEASGDGPLNPEEWRNWLEWMQRHSISWVAWSLSTWME